MPWHDEIEKDLYRLSVMLLKRQGMAVLLKIQGMPETPEDPNNHRQELWVRGVWDTPIYIIGDLKGTCAVEVWVDNVLVLCADADGDEALVLHQWADSSLHLGMQLEIYEALKRYAVLDELANL